MSQVVGGEEQVSGGRDQFMSQNCGLHLLHHGQAIAKEFCLGLKCCNIDVAVSMKPSLSYIMLASRRHSVLPATRNDD